jgi:poly-beta-hydroxybutyrate-responsive repressor
MPADTPSLPRNFLRPCVLLLLREQPSHGYELLERLQPFGFSGEDPGGLYRALRVLERDGLVRSSWERSTEGPHRRIYELTTRGGEELHRRAKELARARDTLGIFLSRYGEFVALTRQSEPARAGRASR